jgi:hypothetical protein
MRHSRCLLFVLSVLLTVRAAWGQTPAVAAPQADTVPPPAWLYNDLACSSTLTTQPPGPLRVLGSQDSIIKHMMGPGDTLVVSGGSNEGLQPGQRFFVRRVLRTYGAMKGPDAKHPLSVHTAGWAQILGVDLDVSTATVVHACEGILLDDYLEPFTEPLIAAQAVPGRTPQYANMGRILTSDEAFETVATGQTINIDRGRDTGVVLGQRYLVFRDKRGMLNESAEYSMTFARNAKRIPLVEVGEVLVVAVGPVYSTVQVLIAKDVITTGDFIAEIR